MAGHLRGLAYLTELTADWSIASDLKAYAAFGRESCLLAFIDCTRASGDNQDQCGPEAANPVYLETQ